MRKLIVILLSIGSLIYLLNPTAGIFELLPDNLPFVGNIDEGLAAFVLFSALEYFRGRPVGMFRYWKK